MNPPAETIPATKPGTQASNARAQALVVCGFLGSGKTTLVRHLLEEGQRDGIRTAVVSNEFDQLGIDEALLSGMAEQASEQGVDFVELSGGCVCCRLSDDLLQTLQVLWERSRPERVIVETSGLALPYDTLINFWRDPVRSWAIDASSVVVVSAEQVAAKRELDATFEDQVCAADYLLVSKTDLVGEQAATDTEQFLESLAGDIPRLRATFGAVDSRIFFPPEAGGASRALPANPHTQPGHRHAHDDYVSQEVTFARGVAEDEVLRVLGERSALRTKGFVETAGGLRLVQGVAGRIEISTPTVTPPPAIVGRVVVIERRTETATQHSARTGEPR